MSKEVIFVADDFGMSAEINDAIVHAHVAGGLQGASLMMGQPGTADAVSRARAHPGLQIGWHLHLCDSAPVTEVEWPWKGSPAAAGLAIGFSRRARTLMGEEVAQQWKQFCETGLECSFVNSHHHLHVHPFVYDALRETIGAAFHGWVRLGRPCRLDDSVPPLPWRVGDSLFLARRRKHSPWRATDTLRGLDRLFAMQAGEVRAAAAQVPDGFHEFLFHPRSRSCPDTLCLLDLKRSLLAA